MHTNTLRLGMDEDFTPKENSFIFFFLSYFPIGNFISYVTTQDPKVPFKLQSADFDTVFP